ncbi:MAG: repeat protein, partial [Verrucomicrobiales bacterium]|nr:repeat protein [Verrucomicrobiales bacterium]
MNLSEVLRRVLSQIAIDSLNGYIAGSVLPLHAQPFAPPAEPRQSEDPYCSVTGEPLKYMSLGTRKMAGMLEKIAQTIDPRGNGFANSLRVTMYRKQLATTTDDAQILNILGQMSVEMLNSGRTLEALHLLEQLQKSNEDMGSILGANFVAQNRYFQALCNLRLGEQENCLTNHNAQSCIFPISAAGVHKLQRGSRRAIEILERQLQDRPSDRVAAWLLNIASMTVGDYPDKVPPAWRIPPEAFKSEYDIKPFPDIAGDLGLDVNGLAGGVIIEDFDGDGNLDILVSDWSPHGPMHFFHNNADGSFSDRTIEAGLSGLAGGLNIIQGDYNNDGLPDVLILRGAWLGAEGNQPDSLLRNDGHGHFSDVTEEAGLLAFHPNQTAVWLDFNGDGWLDLYFAYESGGDNVHPCALYRNNHDGTF